jgi:hypothetical protein
MAIEFVGGAVANKAGATSGNTTITLSSGLTGGIAAAVATNDLVIAVFGSASTADRTLAITDGTNPYTLIDSELYSDDLFDTNLRVAYKFMGGTPDTTTTFGPTGNAADAGGMAVYVFRGVDTSTPLDVAAVPATGNGSGLPNPAGITPTTAGAFGVFAGATAHNGGSDTFTSSLANFRTTGANDNNDVTIGIGHVNDWTSGEINPAAFGHSQADSADFSWAAMSIALRPLADTVDDLTADDVASASSVTAPVIGQAHVLNAADVASASSVTAPVLGQVHALLAADVASASSVTDPAIALVTPLLANDVASASSVSAPAVGQVHALTANDVASASSVSAPVLAEVAAGTDNLLANSVASASSVSTPALTVIGGTAAVTGMELGWAITARERRYREREKAARKADLAKIRKQARRKVIEEVDDRGLLERLSPIGLKAQLTSLIGEAITEVAPAIITAQMRYEMMISIRAEIMRRQADEDDAEAMLLSA